LDGVARIRCSLTCRIGTAGWSIPAAEREAFPAEGSHLERYAARFNAVEINSSFYRPHRRATYVRWAASVGDDFRFSVKLPKTISHARPGEHAEADIERFVGEVTGLGEKLGVVLVQFPPSRVFRRCEVGTLFASLISNLSCPLACEPRHASWFAPPVETLLSNLHVSRVAADPPSVDGVEAPGGWPGLRYHRLHGAPRTYYSRYEPHAIDALRDNVEDEVREADVWCIFDNTAMGAATANALELIAQL
jgi:uncharacterized protein YecE (DUF72 family)